jgi:ribosomal protein L2
MFLKKNKKNQKLNFNYVLKKKGVTSGGSRLSYIFKRKLPLDIKLKKLILSKKNNSGRSKQGSIVMYTKSSRTNRKRLYSVNYRFRLNRLVFIASIIILPFSQKLISLLFLSSGSITYTPSSSNHKLFSTIKMYNFTRNLTKYKNRLHLIGSLFFINQGFFIIYQLPKNQPISLLELLPLQGIKYVRSAGVKAMISKVSRDTNTALVKLPSGVRKVFSVFSLGSPGNNPMSDKSQRLVNKAGYYRNYGHKPKVRGIAKNPVDHPHGGRTKAIKYQRTP